MKHIKKTLNKLTKEILWRYKTTDYKDVASYTNYYEFTPNKTDATVLAQSLKTSPWSVTIEGEAKKTGVFPHIPHTKLAAS